MLELDDLPENVDSLDAQVASFYVNTEYLDRWLDFDEAMFEALWVDGRDIGDVDVLAEIADEIRLDGDKIRTVVADEQRRECLRDRFTEAQQDGVTGVPAFVYDGYGARNAVPPAPLERLVEGT